MHSFCFYLLCFLLDERDEISHLRSSLCVKMTFHWPVHQKKWLPLTRTLQSYLLFPWYWRRPSSGHSCSDSSSILPTLPMTVNISRLKYILVAVEVNYRFFLKIKMNHLVQPKILGQAILQRDRSSRGKSCLEQGKIFDFEPELHNSKFKFSIFETSWVAQFLLSSFKPHASSSLPPLSLLSPSDQTQANIRRSWSKGEPIKTHRSILLYFTNLAS